MQQNVGHRTKKSMITFFLKPSPHLPAFIEDEQIFNEAHWNAVTKIIETNTGEPLWAALSKRPPTSCYTPGKTRPGGYNKNRKYLPAKFIPGKMDKRAGK